MQFKVPQFLDIEDKIFGPFTFRQFVYLAGGAGMCFVLFRLLGFVWGFIPMALVAGLSLALTFYRPNNKPFINMVESMIKYFMQDKLYIWDKTKTGTTVKQALDKNISQEREKVVDPRLTGGKLRDLAWSLDVLDLNQNGDSNERLQ